MAPDKIHLKNLALEEIPKVLVEHGEQRFRAQQIIKWVYQKRVSSFDQMNNIPKTARQKLGEIFTIDKLKPVIVRESSDCDAVKFGFRLIESAHVVECVVLIDGKRRTACLSSQLGCGLGCAFCETGKLGFIRNLTPEEIVGQLIGINDYLQEHGDKTVTKIVFMGMGEALSNFENFRASLETIRNEDTFNIGGRRITVSTAGIVPSIERLMKEPDLNIGLAISLNAFTNEQRSELMPVNRKYPIEQLVAIARRYFEKTGRRVTFEYVVIDGKSNTHEAAVQLERYLGEFPCKINLIPVNPGAGQNFKSPSIETLEKFSDELHRRGLAATVRKSRGRDISGACGQLTAHIVSVQQ